MHDRSAHLWDSGNHSMISNTRVLQQAHSGELALPHKPRWNNQYRWLTAQTPLISISIETLRHTLPNEKRTTKKTNTFYEKHFSMLKSYLNSWITALCSNRGTFLANGQNVTSLYLVVLCSLFRRTCLSWHVLKFINVFRYHCFKSKNCNYCVSKRWYW